MSVLQMSISAGLLVIAIVLIRSVALNKLPKKMFLVLWGVVLFRLLLPVSIPLPFKVPNILGEVSKTVLSGTAAPSVFDNPIKTGNTAAGIIILPETMGQITEATETAEAAEAAAKAKEQANG